MTRCIHGVGTNLGYYLVKAGPAAARAIQWMVAMADDNQFYRGPNLKRNYLYDAEWGDKQSRAAARCLKLTLELAERMLALADEGDAVRQDAGCGVLYGVLRDSAYKLKHLAEAERQAHLKKNREEKI